MKKSIIILLALALLSTLLLISCVKEEPSETSGADSASEEAPTSETTSEPTIESNASSETTADTGLNGEAFTNDNEAEYKDSWG